MRHEAKHTKLTDWLKALRVVVLVGLGDLGQAPKCYAQIHEIPQSQHRDQVLYVKSKEPLFYASLQIRSLRITNILE